MRFGSRPLPKSWSPLLTGGLSLDGRSTVWSPWGPCRSGEMRHRDDSLKGAVGTLKKYGLTKPDLAFFHAYAGEAEVHREPVFGMVREHAAITERWQRTRDSVMMW